MQWITFHSGYDFGYLLKVLTYTPLPPTECEFFELLQVCLSLNFCFTLTLYCNVLLLLCQPTVHDCNPPM